MAMIEARPDLREDHTQGVLVAEHKIMYEKFDNMQAAGRLLAFIRKRKRRKKTLIPDRFPFSFDINYHNIMIHC